MYILSSKTDFLLQLFIHTANKYGLIKGLYISIKDNTKIDEGICAELYQNFKCLSHRSTYYLFGQLCNAIRRVAM